MRCLAVLRCTVNISVKYVMCVMSWNVLQTLVNVNVHVPVNVNVHVIVYVNVMHVMECNVV